MSSQRKYDIIVFGATGYSGKLIAKYLYEHEQSNRREKRPTVSFALAARSKPKLEQFAQQLLTGGSRGDDDDVRVVVVDLIEADVSNVASLDEMCKKTRVLINAVGPFALFGAPVVEACLRNQCHYLDITGEPAFVHLLVTRYHEEAKRKKLKIIPCCGYDSVPADIGTYFTLSQLPREEHFWRYDEKHAIQPGITVEGCLELNVPGGFSGGTFQTLLNSVSSYSKPTQTAAPTQNVANLPRRLHKKLAIKTHYVQELGSYVVPFPTSDPAIVKRSAELNDYSNNGERLFEYGNYLQITSLWKVILFWLFAVLLFVIAQFKCGRGLLQKLYREPGQGPSEEHLRRSYFKLTFLCNAKTRQGEHQIVTQLCGGEPYLETAHISVECAFCLLDILDGNAELSTDDLGVSVVDASGVLTPSVAFGGLLINRLRDSGILFSTNKHSFSRHKFLIEEEQKMRKNVLIDKRPV